MPEAMIDARQALTESLRRLVIRSPTSFSFGDDPPVDVRTLPPVASWGPGMQYSSVVPRADPLVSAIQALLYDRCYAQRSSPPASLSTPGQSVDPAFARALVAANGGRERWEKGWTIHQFGPNGQVFVRKGDRERAAVPGSFIFDGVPGWTPQIGAMVSLRVPHESFDAQPGYYFAFGDVLDELADQMTLVRLYFHCSAESAPRLIGELTGSLNRFQTPFQLKAPAAPGFYGRTDAAVLYVAARHFSVVARIVALVRHEIALEPTTPLFTKRLWPGIGAAVEPGSGESFGTHRCRLTAEGVVSAWRADGGQDIERRLTAVAARFAVDGFDLDRPWLGPSGVDPFDIAALAIR